MGISGLLPLLKDAQEDIHISKYKGKVLGVDAYVWLHRGAYGCAQQLALGQETTRYVNFAMNKVNMLKYHGVTPYIVFDGGPLPAKAKTEDERAKRRSENLRQAKLHLSQGRAQQARDYFVKCVDVTPAMAYQFIKALRLAGVDYIVAPYEADAQLAYLERRGTIDGIITEDSDLIVFGCKTVLYKLNDQGRCIELLHQNRNRCKSLQFGTFSDSLFRQMAILSGCDYLDSIPGMGLKTAHRLLKQCGSVARALSAARMEGMRVPSTYQADFERAEKTFVYQRVFHRSTTTGKVRMVTLTSCPEQTSIDEEDCIGPTLSETMVSGIASGDIDPITKEAIADLSCSQQPSRRTISAPSITSTKSFYGAKKPDLTRGSSMVGQKTLDTFFSRPPIAQSGTNITPRSTAGSPTKRKPLQTITNAAPSSAWSVVETQTIPEEKSKYFTSSYAATQASPPFEQAEFAHLATFTPTQRKRHISRSMSNDSGEISSPACSSIKMKKRRTTSDQLQSSPLIGEEDSPNTSPTLTRPGKKTTRLDDLSPTKTKSPDLIDSDVEEEEEEDDAEDTADNTINVSLFQQFAFQKTPIPLRSASTSMLRKEYTTSSTRSSTKRLILSNEEDENVFIQQHTPTIQRRTSFNVN
ncbi:hypothetical protein CBS101457_006584 [Exobasidium rhododendri]|nr:hypothetical protein CBS101457_006584 [Exobasidium rhododendri]